MMTPTPKLRFVERQHGYKSMSSGEFIGNTVHVLQQWWEGSSMGTINLGWTGDIPIGEVKGEWRDVPVEKQE
jgi:hypothetical protein